MSGLVALARESLAAAPENLAALPARTASENARAISTGFEAAAIAVFTNTASAPISIACAAWDGSPIPASTTTGRSACSMIISICARVSNPLWVPIGAPSGMRAAAPASWRRIAKTGSAFIYAITLKPSLARISAALSVSTGSGSR